MTTRTAAQEGPRARRPAPLSARTLLPPGWPVTAAFAGFPLWWILGISNFVGHIAAAFMLVELLRLGRIRLPKSAGVWLLFLAWVAAGVLVLQVAAPHAVPSSSPGRYLTWAYRFGWYMAATIFMIYIGNMRAQLSTARISRAIAIFFITIAAGGWLGIIAPQLSFPSLLELLLPGKISSIEFVEFLIHPTVVQDYSASVVDNPRPSAPFRYTNIWGLNFACALPFFLAAWWGPTAGWRRYLAVPILLLALVPAITSANRGLWIAILTMTLVVSLRAAFRGHFRHLIAVGAAAALLGLVVALTPLGTVIETRLATPSPSNATRESLASLTTASVIEGSPVIGFGSTRDVASAFYSIAGGDRPSCPECAPPALGTQGQLWLALYSQGVLGLIFYLGFVLRWLILGLRMKSTVATAAVSVLVAQLVTLPVYDSLGIGTVLLLTAVGILWREGDQESDSLASSRSEYTVGGYIRVLRENARSIVACAALGALAGITLQAVQGPPVVARTSLWIPADSPSTGPGNAATLDTVSQFAHTPSVQKAMQEATGRPVDLDTLTVSANPNSRILNLRFHSSDVGTALAGVSAAADALLQTRKDVLEVERRERVGYVDAQYAAVLRSTTLVDTSLALLGEEPTPDDWSEATGLQQTRARVLSTAGALASESATVASMALDAGQVIRPATAWTTRDPLIIKTATGIMLGLLVGLLLARLRGIRGGTPIRKVRDLPGALDLTIIGRLAEHDLARSPGSTEWRREDWARRKRGLVDLARRYRVQAVLSGDDDPLTQDVGCELDDDLPRMTDHDSLAHPSVRGAGVGRALVIVSDTAEFGAVARRVERWRRAGLDIVGVILIDKYGRHKRMAPAR